MIFTNNMKRTKALACLLLLTGKASASDFQIANGTLLEYIGVLCFITALTGLILFRIRLHRTRKELQRQHEEYNALNQKNNEQTKQLNTNLKKIEEKEKEVEKLRKQLKIQQNEWEHTKRMLEEKEACIKEMGKKLQQPPVNTVKSTEEENKLTITVPMDETVTNEKEAFLSQVISFMHKNIDNANLNIEDFAKEQNISRSMFFRKVKSCTRITPIELLHRVRITYSIELLKSGYTFAQIAYMTGFNDPKYFTKCFKRYTGITPSEYKEQCHKKNDHNNKDILSLESSFQFANYLGENLHTLSPASTES